MIDAAAVIDVLAFPPDERALNTMRYERLARCQRLEEHGRLALFVSVGLSLAWAADVGAAFGPAPGPLALAFGIASFVLAATIVVAHVAGRRALRRAQALQRAIYRDFGPVRLLEAQPLLMHADKDRVVAQYLRMVGRQRRALCQLELTSLCKWANLAAKPVAPGPAAFGLEVQAGAATSTRSAEASAAESAVASAEARVDCTLAAGA